MIPSEYQTFSTRMRRRSWPACSTKERIFRPITGSTQGMTFRIRPPRKASRIMGNSGVWSTTPATLPCITSQSNCGATRLRLARVNGRQARCSWPAACCPPGTGGGGSSGGPTSGGCCDDAEGDGGAMRSGGAETSGGAEASGGAELAPAATPVPGGLKPTLPTASGEGGAEPTSSTGKPCPRVATKGKSRGGTQAPASQVCANTVPSIFSEARSAPGASWMGAYQMAVRWWVSTIRPL